MTTIAKKIQQDFGPKVWKAISDTDNPAQPLHLWDGLEEAVLIRELKLDDDLKEMNLTDSRISDLAKSIIAALNSAAPLLVVAASASTTTTTTTAGGGGSAAVLGSSASPSSSIPEDRSFQERIQSLSQFHHLGGELSTDRAIAAAESVPFCANAKRALTDFLNSSARTPWDLLPMASRGFDTTLVYSASRAGNVDALKILQDWCQKSNKSTVVAGTPANLTSRMLHTTYPELRGHTPLHIACMLGRKSVATWLLSQGADVKKQNEDGETPLQSIADQRQRQVFATLIFGNVPKPLPAHSLRMEMLDAAGAKGNNAAKLAALKQFLDEHPEWAARCIDFEEDDIPDKMTFLYKAAARDNRPAVDLLLACNPAADPLDNERGDTPLHIAAYLGHKEVVASLVEHLRQNNRLGEISSAVNHNGSRPGETFLRSKVDYQTQVEIRKVIAAAEEDERSASTLSEVESDAPQEELSTQLLLMLDAAGAKGNNAKLAALKQFLDEHPEWAARCIDFEEDDIPDKMTLLYKAAARDNRPAVDLLLACNPAADPLDNERGDTPLHIAAYLGHKEVVASLVEHLRRNNRLSEISNARNKKGQCPGQSFLQSKVTQQAQDEIRKLLGISNQNQSAAGISSADLASFTRDVQSCAPLWDRINCKTTANRCRTFSAAAAAAAGAGSYDSLTTLEESLVKLVADACARDHLERLGTSPLGKEVRNAAFFHVFGGIVEKFNTIRRSSGGNAKIQSSLLLTAEELDAEVCRHLATALDAVLEPLKKELPLVTSPSPEPQGLSAWNQSLTDLSQALWSTMDTPTQQILEKSFRGIPAGLWLTGSVTMKHLHDDFFKRSARVVNTKIYRLFSQKDDAQGAHLEILKFINSLDCLTVLKVIDKNVDELVKQEANTGKILKMSIATVQQKIKSSVALLLQNTSKAIMRFASAVGKPMLEQALLGCDAEDAATAIASQFVDFCAPLIRTENEKLVASGGLRLFDDFTPLCTKAVVDFIKNKQQWQSPLGAAHTKVFLAELAKVNQQTIKISDLKGLLFRIIRPIHLIEVWRPLPIFGQLETIMQAYKTSDIILVRADTGSGKSVGLPQYLCHCLEYQHSIIVTQPRRTPVVKTGTHVGSQFGEKWVMHEVAGVKHGCPATAKLHYNTDGLLLERRFGEKVRQSVPAAGSKSQSKSAKAPVTVIDEVHERNVNMELLLMHLADELKHQRGTVEKLFLVSATVDCEYFDTIIKEFNKMTGGKQLSFATLDVKVAKPYKITDAPPSGGHLNYDPTALPSARPNYPVEAATEAMRIMTADPKSKVVVFLPKKRECEEATRHFVQISHKGNFAASAIFARVSSIQQKLASSDVLFSTNVLETSITVPGLTHVLDCDLVYQNQVDREGDVVTFDSVPCSQSSADQRRGRLGRVQDGTYISFHGNGIDHPSATPSVFDSKSNEELMQVELRLNELSGLSLFSGQALPSVLNLPPPPVLLRFLPTDPKERRIISIMSMPPTLGKAFTHLFKTKTCPLAVIWLQVMLESTEPVMLQQNPISASLATHLGQNGDHGLLLDLYAAFVRAKVDPTNQKALQAWCTQQGGVNPLFMGQVAEGIERRVGRVKMLEDLQLVPVQLSQTQTDSLKWKWDDIAIALLTGGPDKLCLRVDHTYGRDLEGKYLQLKKAQRHKVNIFSSSSWYASGLQTSLPRFILYHNALKCFGGHGSYMDTVSAVDEKLISQVKAAEWDIKHYIGIAYHICYLTTPQYWSAPGNVLSLGKQTVSNPVQGSTPWKVEVEITQVEYPLAAGSTTQSIDPEFEARLKKTNMSKRTVKFQVAVSGPRIQVGFAMEYLALCIDICEQNHQQSKQAQQTLSSGGPSISLPLGAPMDLGSLKRIDPRAGDRLLEMTDLSRCTALKNASSLPREQGIRLLMNLLVNKFQCTIKGGGIRDGVVLNVPINDIDLKLPQTLSRNSWRTTFGQWASEVKRDYNLNLCDFKEKAGHMSIYNHQADFLLGASFRSPFGGSDVEVDMIPPWNHVSYNPKEVDMSANNLAVTPADAKQPQISSIVGIGISTELAARWALQRCTAPIHDVFWKKYDPSSHSSFKPDGWNKDKHVVGDSSTNMDFRCKKMRGKGFRFVESVQLTANGKQLVMYHATDSAARDAICDPANKNNHPGFCGFRPGKSGNFGAGIYVTSNYKMATQLGFGSNYIKVTFRPGSICEMTTNDPSQSWTKGGKYQTSHISAQDAQKAMGRNFEEFCISNDGINNQKAEILKTEKYP